MYALDDMIDMGLKENQKFPTEAHRQVAVNVAIDNPRFCTRDDLIEVVQAIIMIPDDRIKTVTAKVLVDEFGVPPYMGTQEF